MAAGLRCGSYFKFFMGELGGRAVACCGTAFGARENLDSYVLNEKQGQHANALAETFMRSHFRSALVAGGNLAHSDVQ